MLECAHHGDNGYCEGPERLRLQTKELERKSVVLSILTPVVRLESRGCCCHEGTNSCVARLSQENLNGVARFFQKFDGVVNVVASVPLIELDVSLVVETGCFVRGVRSNGFVPNVVSAAIGDSVHGFVQVHPGRKISFCLEAHSHQPRIAIHPELGKGLIKGLGIRSLNWGPGPVRARCMGYPFCEAQTCD